MSQKFYFSERRITATTAAEKRTPTPATSATATMPIKIIAGVAIIGVIIIGLMVMVASVVVERRTERRAVRHRAANEILDWNYNPIFNQPLKQHAEKCSPPRLPPPPPKKKSKPGVNFRNIR